MPETRRPTTPADDDRAPTSRTDGAAGAPDEPADPAEQAARDLEVANDFAPPMPDDPEY